MERNDNVDKNKSFHLEDSMIMYSTYNAETVENLVDTLEKNFTIRLHGIKITWG